MRKDLAKFNGYDEMFTSCKYINSSPCKPDQSIISWEMRMGELCACLINISLRASLVLSEFRHAQVFAYGCRIFTPNSIVSDVQMSVQPSGIGTFHMNDSHDDLSLRCTLYCKGSVQ